jgi:hypothetical protein
MIRIAISEAAVSGPCAARASRSDVILRLAAETTPTKRTKR